MSLLLTIGRRMKIFNRNAIVKRHKQNVKWHNRTAKSNASRRVPFNVATRYLNHSCLRHRGAVLTAVVIHLYLGEAIITHFLVNPHNSSPHALLAPYMG